MIGQWSGKSKIFLRLVWYLHTRARYFSFACLLFFLRNALPEGSLPFQRRNSVVLNTLWLQTQLTSLIFSWMNELSALVMKREELNLTLFVYIVFYFVLFFFFSLILLFIFSHVLSAAVFPRKAEFFAVIFQKRGIQLLKYFTWNH